MLLAMQLKSKWPTKSRRKNKLGVSEGASEGARVALCQHNFWLITVGGISVTDKAMKWGSCETHKDQQKDHWKMQGDCRKRSNYIGINHMIWSMS